MSVDVKKLAALPGFGSAQKAIAGELGPFAAADGPIDVTVRMRGQVWGTAYYVAHVTASTPEEARSKAVAKADRDGVRGLQVDSGSVDWDDDDAEISRP